MVFFVVMGTVFQRIFQARGKTDADIRELLSWDLKALPDLSDMEDLSSAAKRIIQGMDRGETIGVYGDYDADGTTSCALLFHFFQMLETEAKVEFIQPSRFQEGYGLHKSSVNLALEKGITLLITVDCGITGFAAADYAHEKKGPDLIITDHHLEGEGGRPKALAVINPNRRDAPPDSPLCSLAGVGVAFALSVEIRRQLLEANRPCPSLYGLLPFVAIGTICDMVPLNSMNLKLVRHGLKQLGDCPFPGLLSFLTPEERKNGIHSSEKLAFGIGPLINAKGRLDHPERALKLLISSNAKDAYEHFSHLEICNRQRKEIQAQVFVEAKEQVLGGMNGPIIPSASIVFSPHWHEGVIGIVASKLVEEFKVPAIVFTHSGEKGVLKASARTAGPLNIFEHLKSHSDLFIKFGGHKAAAGLSMSRDHLEEFRKRFTADLLTLPPSLRTTPDEYDCDIFHKEITPNLVRELERIGPFGQGHHLPVFRMRGAHLDSYDVFKGLHVRWNFSNPTNPRQRFRGISFNYLKKWGHPSPQDIYMAQESGEPLTAFFSLGINRFRGNEYIQLQVRKIDSGPFSESSS